MSEEIKVKIVKDALDRAYTALEQTPAEQMPKGEFLNLLCAIDHLEYLREGAAPAQDSSSADDAPQPSEDPTPNPKPDMPKHTRADVKAALMDARKKGVNILELLREVGAEDLDSVPESKYDTLMAKVAEVAPNAT